MASEYGSCPVEAAAHQMRMRRDVVRADISAGMTVSRNCSNGLLSRKKNNSLVVIASTTSTISGSASGPFSLATRPVRLNRPCLRAIGISRLSTR